MQNMTMSAKNTGTHISLTYVRMFGMVNTSLRENFILCSLIKYSVLKV